MRLIAQNRYRLFLTDPHLLRIYIYAHCSCLRRIYFPPKENIVYNINTIILAFNRLKISISVHIALHESRKQTNIHTVVLTEVKNHLHQQIYFFEFNNILPKKIS